MGEKTVIVDCGCKLVDYVVEWFYYMVLIDGFYIWILWFFDIFRYDRIKFLYTAGQGGLT